MEVPESIPIVITPETQKNLTPAAVKRAEPPVFGPERETCGDHRGSKRRREQACDRDGKGDEFNAPQDESSEATRGTRINVRA